MQMMRALANFFERRAHSRTEGPFSLQSDGAVSIFSRGPNNGSGIFVDERVAMTYTAVYACVKIIAESIASLPLVTYRRKGEDGRSKATDLPIYDLLHSAPNPDMTSMSWREAMLAHILLWGNHYSKITWRNTQVESLTPLPPWWVRVERVKNADGSLGPVVYHVTPPNGKAEVVRASEMLHIPGLSFNGTVGLSVIEANAEAIGAGMAAMRTAGTWFGNGSHPSGILKTKSVLKADAKKALKEAWEGAHQGVQNGQRTAVLDGDMDWQSVQINPKDAMLIEARSMSVGDAARIFRVPLVLLNAGEAGTSVWGSGVEQIMIGFVTHTLRPHFVRIEQEIQRKLLWPEWAKQIYVEHMDGALLRGDLKSRYEAYAVGRQWGWLSPNDVRRKENEEPIPGPEGDSYVMPANITGKVEKGPTDTTKDPEKGAEDDSADRALSVVLTRDLETVVAAEIKRLRRAVDETYRKDPAEFLAWVEGYYRTFGAFVSESLRSAQALVPVESWSKEAGERYAAGSLSALSEALRKSTRQAYDGRAAILATLDLWQEGKAAMIVASERKQIAALAAGG